MLPLMFHLDMNAKLEPTQLAEIRFSVRKPELPVNCHAEDAEMLERSAELTVDQIVTVRELVTQLKLHV